MPTPTAVPHSSHRTWKAGDARYGTNSGAFDQVGWSTMMFYIADDDVVTGINRCTAQSSASYNLAGLKTAPGYRGLVIKNGRKYFQ